VRRAGAGRGPEHQGVGSYLTVSRAALNPTGFTRTQQARLPLPSSPWPGTHLTAPYQRRSFVFAAVCMPVSVAAERNSAARRRLGGVLSFGRSFDSSRNRQLRNIQERDAPRPALRAHQPAFQSREREICPACPNQRLHIQLGTIDALANGFHAIAIAECATCRDPPPEPPRLAECLNRHRTN